MQITKETYNSTAVIKPRGQLLGSHAAQALDTSLAEIEQNGVSACIIDFSHVSLMTCRSVGTLVKRRKTFKQAGKELHITKMNDRIKGLFQLTGLTDYFQIDIQKQHSN